MSGITKLSTLLGDKHWTTKMRRFLLFGTNEDRPKVYDHVEVKNAGIAPPIMDSVDADSASYQEIFIPDGVTYDWETNRSQIDYSSYPLTVAHDNGFTKISGNAIRNGVITQSDYTLWHSYPSIDSRNLAITPVAWTFDISSLPAIDADETWVLEIELKQMHVGTRRVQAGVRRFRTWHGDYMGELQRRPGDTSVTRRQLYYDLPYGGKIWEEPYYDNQEISGIDKDGDEIRNTFTGDRHLVLRPLIKFNGDSDFRAAESNYVDISRIERQQYQSGNYDRVWQSGSSYKIYCCPAAQGQNLPANIDGVGIRIDGRIRGNEGIWWFGKVRLFQRRVGTTSESFRPIDRTVAFQYFDSESGAASMLSREYQANVMEITQSSEAVIVEGSIDFVIDSADQQDWSRFDKIRVWAKVPNINDYFFVNEIDKASGTVSGTEYTYSNVPVNGSDAEIANGLSWNEEYDNFRYIAPPFALGEVVGNRLAMAGGRSEDKMYLTFTQGSVEITSATSLFSDRDYFSFIKAPDNRVYQISDIVSGTKANIAVPYRGSTTTDLAVIFSPRDYVYFSDMNFFEGFNPETFIQPDGQGDPTLIVPYRSGALIGFERGIFFLTDVSSRYLETAALVVVSKNVGCVSQRTVLQLDNGSLAWLWTSGIFSPTGEQIVNIAEVIQEFFDDIDPDKIGNSFGVFWPRRTWAIWCVPKKDGTWDRVIYDMPNQAFVIHEDVPDTSYCIVPNEQGEGQWFIGTRYGDILKYDESISYDESYYSGVVDSYDSAGTGRILTDADGGFAIVGITPTYNKVYVALAAGGFVKKLITFNTATELYADTPFEEDPTGQAYHVGAIPFTWQSKTIRLDNSNMLKPNYLTIAGSVPINSKITIRTTNDFVDYTDAATEKIEKAIEFQYKGHIKPGVAFGRGVQIKIEGVQSPGSPFYIEDLTLYSDYENG